MSDVLFVYINSLGFKSFRLALLELFCSMVKLWCISSPVGVLGSLNCTVCERLLLRHFSLLDLFCSLCMLKVSVPSVCSQTTGTEISALIVFENDRVNLFFNYKMFVG